MFDPDATDNLHKICWNSKMTKSPILIHNNILIIKTCIFLFFLKMLQLSTRMLFVNVNKQNQLLSRTNSILLLETKPVMAVLVFSIWIFLILPFTGQVKNVLLIVRNLKLSSYPKKQHLSTKKHSNTVNHYNTLFTNRLNFMSTGTMARDCLGLIYSMLQKLTTRLLEIVTKQNTSHYTKNKN